jgi:nicotinate-nucleotide adenylyltransferase
VAVTADRTGILGGAFDPPHEGHLALARAAIARFRLERLLVRVVDAPGHKVVVASAASRLRLAELAFASIPEAEISRDAHARTVDSLVELGLVDPIFLIGADEFLDFPAWKDPERVLELARLGVATRPGYGRAALEAVLARLSRPERVEFFQMAPLPISSSDLRDRIAAGASVESLVPPAVAAEIERAGLYGHAQGYTGAAS